MSECVVVLRQLLQQNAFNNSGSISNTANNTVCVKILRQLVKLLIVKNGLESEATARSSVVWLVGEFHHMLDGVAPDVLRILAAGFTGMYVCIYRCALSNMSCPYKLLESIMRRIYSLYVIVFIFCTPEMRAR